jgi:hypothetical protein
VPIEHAVPVEVDHVVGRAGVRGALKLGLQGRERGWTQDGEFGQFAQRREGFDERARADAMSRKAEASLFAF